MRLSQAALAFLAISMVLVGCTAGLATPAYVGQPSEALAHVGYPPPPARVEHVPPRPRAGAVWIDGEWAWQGHAWAWQSGRWVMAPAGCRFSPWTSTWADDGSVYYAPGVWRDAVSRVVADPEALATAKPARGPITDPEGEQETTGRRRRDAAPKRP